MAEDCKCIMTNEFKHIAEEMTDRKNNERDMQKNISDIRTIQEKTMYVTEQVQKSQDLQAIRDEKNQELVIRTNKENQELNATWFKAIEERQINYEKKMEYEKKELDKENKAKEETRRKEKIIENKERKKSSRDLRIGIIFLIANLVMGILVKYYPTLIGLPKAP